MIIRTNPQTLELKSKSFRGFSDPSRLAILEALRDKPLVVAEIVAATGLSQSNASNHLACLYDCGLVSREQEGRYVRYRLRDTRVAALLSLADELLADVAKGIYECTRYTLTNMRARWRSLTSRAAVTVLRFMLIGLKPLFIFAYDAREKLLWFV